MSASCILSFWISRSIVLPLKSSVIVASGAGWPLMPATSAKPDPISASLSKFGINDDAAMVANFMTSRSSVGHGAVKVVDEAQTNNPSHQP
jgi:hypothetical protein